MDNGPSKKKTAWNKGIKQAVKKLNYTNGTVNIKVIEGEQPPGGFYRGQVRHIDPDKFAENKRIQVQKTLETKISKYGSTSYNNKEKRYQTNLERYGTESYTQSEDFKKKSEATCMEKYGVKRAMQSKEGKARYKQALLDKYGVENISQIHENNLKVSNT